MQIRQSTLAWQEKRGRSGLDRAAISIGLERSEGEGTLNQTRPLQAISPQENLRVGADPGKRKGREGTTHGRVKKRNAAAQRASHRSKTAAKSGDLHEIHAETPLLKKACGGMEKGWVGDVHAVSETR